MVVDPWGKIVGALKNEPGVLVVELDMSYKNDIRNQLPALANRML